MANAGFDTSKESINENTTKETTKDPEIYAADTLKNGLQKQVTQVIISIKTPVTFTKILKNIFSHGTLYSYY